MGCGASRPEEGASRGAPIEEVGRKIVSDSSKGPLDPVHTAVVSYCVALRVPTFAYLMLECIFSAVSYINYSRWICLVVAIPLGG